MALKNASTLSLNIIKEFCLKFIIKESNYNQVKNDLFYMVWSVYYFAIEKEISFVNLGAIPQLRNANLNKNLTPSVKQK